MQDGVSQLRLEEIHMATNEIGAVTPRDLPAYKRKPLQKHPKQTSTLNLSGYSFLRERCMGQWMSREMPDGGVCEALSGPARHETRCQALPG